MSRSVAEWIAKTDDDAIPQRVQLRIFTRHDGICQCGCGKRIMAGEKWTADHRIALINGGEHRESNLQPMLVAHHAIKTRNDVAIKSKIARTRASHLGIKRQSSRPMPGGRNSPWKKTFGRGWVKREANESSR